MPRPNLEPTSRSVNSSWSCKSANTSVSFTNSSPLSGNSSHMSCDTSGPTSAYSPLSVDPKSRSQLSASKPSQVVPTRIEFARRNYIYYSDDDEGLSDRDRYPLGTFPLFGEEAESLTTYRRDGRIWWTELCEFDEVSYKYVPTNPPISTADLFLSYKVGLEEELQYKTANQWSRSQAKIRIEGPNTVRARLPE